MVKYLVDGPIQGIQAGGSTGWDSFLFKQKADVPALSPTGFVMVYSPLNNIPGLPWIADPAPDTYSGEGLEYASITLFGTTMAAPFAGTITGMSEDGRDFSVIVDGLNLDAADFFRVSATPDDKDNIALTEQIYAGSDEFTGGWLRDVFQGYAGDDRLIGRAGNDWLRGGEGDDTVRGGGGDDRLQGGRGNDTVNGHNGDDIVKGAWGHDTLSGGVGNDSMRGGAGRDLLVGGTGNDHMNAGRGADVFLFKGTGLGADVIEAFNPFQDRIAFEDGGVSGLDDLRLLDTGDGAVIAYSGGSILLADLGWADMVPDFFVF